MKIEKRTYQEWWRDWPYEAQQPVVSDKGQVISDKLLNFSLLLEICYLPLVERGAKS